MLRNCLIPEHSSLSKQQQNKGTRESKLHLDGNVTQKHFQLPLSDSLLSGVFLGRIQALIPLTQAILGDFNRLVCQGKTLTQANYSPPSSGTDLWQQRQLERAATIPNNSTHINLSGSHQRKNSK